MWSDPWAVTLSWCNIQVWFFHNSGLFLRTASLKRAENSWYNCLFTIWPHGTNSWWTMPFQSKNTTNITLIFDRLIRAFFGREDPFPIHCDDCILVSTPHPLTHVSSSVTMFLRKFWLPFVFGKQFLTDFNTILFLMVNQQTRPEFLH